MEIPFFWGSQHVKQWIISKMCGGDAVVEGTQQRSTSAKARRQRNEQGLRWMLLLSMLILTTRLMLYALMISMQWPAWIDILVELTHGKSLSYYSI
jgi:hypothetical protein